MVKRIVLALVCLFVVVGAGAAGATQIRWPGRLDCCGYGNGNGLPVATGSDFTIFMTAFRPRHRIRIESIRLHHATPGLVLVGALVLTDWGKNGLAGAERRFPPREQAGVLRSARGVVIPAHKRVAIQVGLRAVRDGSFRAEGIDVLYREHRFGIDLRRHAHVGTEVDVCARKSTGIPHCHVPDFSVPLG
jgi:hypothetical protein